jgi:hypothetical protein
MVFEYTATFCELVFRFRTHIFLLHCPEELSVTSTGEDIRNALKHAWPEKKILVC